jgi:putative transposase
VINCVNAKGKKFLSWLLNNKKISNFESIPKIPKMSLFQDKYRVESIRLHGYDYSKNGMYFVTVCTRDRRHLFGKIEKRTMILNQYGIIVEQCWHEISSHYSNFVADEFVVMPDHIHAIIIIKNDMESASVAGTEINIVETGFKPVSTDTPDTPNITRITDCHNNPLPPTKQQNHHGLPEFVRALKTFSARRINELRQTPGINIWQTGYYDHIIHSQNEYKRIKMYIRNNPNNWPLKT